jgi:uncharacterized protein (TIGR03790 family)
MARIFARLQPALMGLIWRRHGRKVGSIFFCIAAGCLAAPARGEESLARQVVILANADDPDSLRIAHHYAEVRQLPAGNIVALKMPLGETVSWREFIASIWNPLREELVKRKWVDAIPIAVDDPIGRKKYAVNGHHVAALVICRGVPMRITHEPEFYTENRPLTVRKEYRSNAGTVDSELSLLGVNTYNINAFVVNPLYQNDAPSELQRESVIAVGRLDGPTPQDALALVDRAVAVERTGLIGRGYVDIGGIFPEAEKWFEDVAAQLNALGFDTAVDRAPTTMPATARCDAPALYFGWYASDLNGPFALPGFQFAPGAVALHIHSFSAGTMRSATIGWTAPFVVRGVTGTVGNVHEPYLMLTHRPDFLLRALARGATLGEAALYALPALSWQPILVGDPLYRPFAVGFEAQWKKRAELPPQLMPYVVLRQMHRLETAGQKVEALALLRETQQNGPSLPVGLALAERLQAAGDGASAAVALAFAADLKNFPTDQWALAHDAAGILAANGAAGPALNVYRALFSSPSFPRELRIAWLPAALKIATAAGDAAQEATWRRDWEELGGVPAEAKK